MAKIDCTPAQPLGRFVGVDYSVFEDRIECSQANYAGTIEVPDGPVPLQPLPSNINSDTDTSCVLSAAASTGFRKLLGSFAYVAQHTFPACAYASSWLSRYNVQPTETAWRLLCGAVRFMKHNIGKHPLIIRRADCGLGEIELVAFVDASLGNSVQPYATSGIIVTLGGTPVAYRSHKQSRVAHSTEKSEFNAAAEATDLLFFLKQFLKPVCHHVKCILQTDAKNVLDLVSTDHPKPSEKALIDAIRKLGDKTLMVPAMAVAHTIEDARIILVKVDTKLNLADALTKSMDVTAILKSMAGNKPEIIADLPKQLVTEVPADSGNDLIASDRWARDGRTLRQHVKPPERYVPSASK